MSHQTRIQQKHLFVFAFVPCMLVLSLAHVQAQDLFNGFAERIEAEREAWGAPGLAIAVVHKDEVAFVGGFGVRDSSTGEPVDEHTLFHVGSTTKAFTAAALGLLVDDGKLAWDDKVIELLPAFRVADPYVTQELTIVDLLSHRSGVQTTDLLWVRGFTPDDYLPRLVHAEQSSSLRSKFEYNNGMYIVAGELIEAVSGQSFTEFVRNRFFEPLGMHRTTGPLTEIAQRENVAMSHYKIGDEMVPIGLTDEYDAGGAGLFYSSVAEYVNWLRMWLNEGKLDDTQILQSDTVAAHFRPRITLEQPIYPAAQAVGVSWFCYGQGWFLHDYRGRRVNMHTGSIDGMSAIVGLMPDENLGVVIFINADQIELRHALMYETFDRVLGGEHRDWSGEFRVLYQAIADGAAAQREKQMASLDADARPPLPLEQYAGVYRHAVFGDVEVVVNDEQLYAHLLPLLKFRLRPAGDHGFLAYRLRRGFEDAADELKHTDPLPTQFEIGGDNRPARFVLPGLGVEFERVEEDE